MNRMRFLIINIDMFIMTKWVKEVIKQLEQTHDITLLSCSL